MITFVNKFLNVFVNKCDVTFVYFVKIKWCYNDDIINGYIKNVSNNCTLNSIPSLANENQKNV